MIIKQERMINSKSISIKEKILIVCQVIAWKKIQSVAKKHKASRPSVYTWKGESFKQSGASPQTREMRT
jgi:hypothetical protein